MALPEVRPSQDSYDMARDDLESIIEFLKSSEAGTLTHSMLEDVLNERGRELLRRLLQAHIDARGPGEAATAVKGVEGIERDTARVHDRELATIFGDVRVKRMGYGAEGMESLHPLDAELNLPDELYSFGLRRRAAGEAAKGSFDETVKSLVNQTGTEVPKRQVEQIVRRAAVDFDAFYAERSPPKGARSASILVLTSDGKGVVMRRSDLRPQTRKAAEKKRHKLKNRLTKGEKRNAKRMATVVAVYTTAPFVRTPHEIVRLLAPQNEPEKAERPRPENKRVWASLVKEPEDVIAEGFAEAQRRDPRHVKTWVAVVDGNKDQLRSLRKLAQRYRVDLVIIVDFIHVCEYVWKASLAFYGEDDPVREEWVRERLLRILCGHASDVAAGMRRSATLRGLATKTRKPVDDCANYLLTYSPFLHYDDYLAAGFPIASGVIEGACRHLVKDRMDVTGARWSLAGAEAVLRLRALRSSGDFDEYWRLHERQEYERNHAARYADGQPAPTRGRHLRVIK